jgi:ABC-type nickel/cobalt efflux system permease component RcnA
MNHSPELLLVGAVAAVGVLHTIVPDHWAPITLIARQRKWTTAQTISAAAKAGTGHVLSTLLIALLVWFAGSKAAVHFGRLVDIASSAGLVIFGCWIAVASWFEMRSSSKEHEDDHALHHDHSHKAGHRTALVLILGSSPMVEGIPAFFAASQYGVGLILLMSFVFAISTIGTYILLCVYSTKGLERMELGAFERYGEVLSGFFIALVGLIFWIRPFF